MDTGSEKLTTVEKLLTTIPVYLQKVKCDTTPNTLPFKCAVKCCTNYFYKFEDRDKYPYKFHKFPADRNVCNVWRGRCGLRMNADVSNKMICSNHFYLDDYQRNYKQEFIDPNFKRVLKANAIPTQNLTSKGEDIKIEPTLESDHSYHIAGTKVVPKVTPKEVPREILDLNDVKRTVDLNDALHEKCKNLTVKLRNIKQKSKQLEKSTKIFKQKLAEHQNDVVEVDEVQKVFSPSQINLLLGKKKVYWTDDDLARAFTLRHIGGKKCYLYLKNTLNFPLPALSCVQRWASTV